MSAGKRGFWKCTSSVLRALSMQVWPAASSGWPVGVARPRQPRLRWVFSRGPFQLGFRPWAVFGHQILSLLSLKRTTESGFSVFRLPVFLFVAVNDCSPNLAFQFDCPCTATRRRPDDNTDAHKNFFEMKPLWCKGPLEENRSRDGGTVNITSTSAARADVGSIRRRW